MPGYLGSATDFRERYELPITREKSVDAQARLARRVRPFLLRRLKREVAKDLPERIEQVSYCEMTEDQRAAYQQILEISRREVVQSVEAQGRQKSRMVVLNALAAPAADLLRSAFAQAGGRGREQRPPASSTCSASCWRRCSMAGIACWFSASLSRC